MHVACGAGGSVECIKFLVEKNTTRYGDTSLTLAIGYEHRDIVKYFVEKFKIISIDLEDLYVILD